MANIKITPSELGELSRELSAVSQQIDNDFTTVEKLLRKLSFSWSGESIAVANQIEEQLYNSKHLIEYLNVLSMYLRKAQEQYQQTEASIVDSFASQFRI